MLNPLDALSALTKVAAPMSQMNAMPTVPGISTNGITEPFNAIAGQLNAIPGQPNTITENIGLLQPHDVPSISVPSVSSTGSPNTWGHMVQQMVMDVNSKQQSATAAVNDVLKGGPTPVHEAMVASEEASLSFELVAEMRNKVVEAYQQVMQMQV